LKEEAQLAISHEDRRLISSMGGLARSARTDHDQAMKQVRASIMPAYVRRVLAEQGPMPEAEAERRAAALRRLDLQRAALKSAQVRRRRKGIQEDERP
jgi:hypothetical protein